MVPVIQPLVLSGRELRSTLQTSKLFHEPVSPVRSAALQGFVEELVYHHPAISRLERERTLSRAGLGEQELEFLRGRFKAVTERRIRNPGRPLTAAQKSLFNRKFATLLSFRWNAQAAGAFLAFANLEDEEIPTAASAIFPNLESFQATSLEIPGWEYPVPLPRRFNNFLLYFVDVPENEIYRQREIYQRFSREQPERSVSLTEEITGAFLGTRFLGSYIPAQQSDLFKAYKAMASYVEEVKELEDFNPARALIK